MNYPFYYEVQFRLFAFDEENNIVDKKHTKPFKDSSPLENRAEAFVAFEDYLSFIPEGRIEKNEQGNYVIIQPSFVSYMEHEDKEEIAKKFDRSVENKPSNIDNEFSTSLNELRKTIAINNYVKYREDITIYLVITDEKLLEELGASEGENEFEIHKVASYEFEEQDIVDNLDFFELQLYHHFRVDVSSLVETVYHYWLDYSESGEEENGAKRTILKTPYKWKTLEMYEQTRQKYPTENFPEIKRDSDEIYLQLIAQGESNQVEFKPSLRYDFYLKKEANKVRHIIAKNICAFLNSNGGFLFVGVNDNREVQGLEISDYLLFAENENKRDKILVELDNLLTSFFSHAITPFISAEILSYDSKDILMIRVESSYRPVWLKNWKNNETVEEFYIRKITSTLQISDTDEIEKYIFNKTWRKSPNE